MKTISTVFLFLFASTTLFAQNVFPANGSVGIGTNSPTALLEVNGLVKTKKVEIYNFNAIKQLEIGSPLIGDRNFNFAVSNLLGSDYTDFYIKDNNNTQRMQFFNDGQKSLFSLYDDSEFNYFAARQDKNLPFEYQNYVHMPYANSKIVIGGYADYLGVENHKLIVQNGSALIEGNIFTDQAIGIGTRNFIDGSDVYKLSVKGKIRADEVKVYTTWADFVFEKDYDLKSLKDVEAYINEHGHLKDVPSEEHVLNNGIEIGEMNKILLQKIEELTLYVIDLQKQIDNLSKD